MKRFGQYLIDKKLITQDQLNEALQSQATFGGRLGTNLVELGYLSLNILAEQLTLFVGVKNPPREVATGITSPTLAIIPRKMVVNFMVVPMMMDDREIHVGMMDPRNAKQVDEIQFATGKRVVPYLIPELRMHFWLEKYYGIKRSFRFVNIEREAMKKRFSVPLLPDPPEQKPKSEAIPVSGDDGLFDKLTGSQELTDEGEFNSIYAEKREGKELPKPLEEIESLEEIEVVDEESATPVSYSEPIVAGKKVVDPQEFEEKMMTANTREDLMASALNLALVFSEAAAIFVVHRDMVQGIFGKGCGLESRAIDGILFPIEIESALTKTAKLGQIFQGVPPDTNLDQRFLQALGRGKPKEFAFFPVRIRERIVNVLYVDAGEKEISRIGRGGLEALALSMGEAYEKLILHFKSQDVS